jgi:hypothetical protein
MHPRLFCVLAALFVSVLFPAVLVAQTGKVLVRNAPGSAPALTVKWYTSELYYDRGVNVYRREAGATEWTKLNAQPLRRQEAVSEAAGRQDSSLRLFAGIIQQASKADLKGFILLNLLVKSFDSPAYARFLGIQYDDPAVTAGKTYQYRIARVQGGGEVEIGTSAPVTVTGYAPEPPPANVVVKMDTNKVKIAWKPDDDRFYGVNIYRRSLLAKEMAKITPRPVMISRDSLGREDYPEFFFEDDSLQTGATYTYQLAGTGFFGEETERSAPVEVLIKDLVPPLPPVDFKDKVNNLQVALSWAHRQPADLGGFYVYRATRSDGPFERVNAAPLGPAVRAYTDRVARSGPYYYYVAAADAAGNEARSGVRFVEVHDIVPPARPEGVTIRADTGRIVLSWQPNAEKDLMGYQVYRAVNRNGKDDYVLLNANPVTDTRIVEKLPKNAKNRFLYKIVALDSAYNKSPFSEVATARMPDVVAPEQPFLKTVTADGKLTLMQWVPNADPDLKGYQLYRANEGHPDDFQRLNVSLLPGKSFRYTDRTPAEGVTYFYCLQAVDSSGNASARSNIVAFRNGNVKTPPAGLRSTRATFNKARESAVLSWKTDEASDLLGFVLFRRAADDGPWLPLTGLFSGDEYTDKDIRKGTTYYYEIRAYFRSGSVSHSEALAVKVE